MEVITQYPMEDFWLKIAICVLLFLAGTLLPAKLFCKSNPYWTAKFASRRWIMCVAWFCFSIFCVLLDGPLLESRVTHIVFICTSVQSLIFAASSTIEKLVLRKGEWEISLDMSKQAQQRIAEKESQTPPAAEKRRTKKPQRT